MPGALRIAIFVCGVLYSLGAAASATAAGVSAHASIGFEPIPLSVAADGAGHVYLSNPLRSTSIQQYSSDGAMLANVGTFPGSGNPFEPRDIATDAAGNLYVASGGRAAIYVLGPNGESLRQWSASGGRDLAVGTDGSVYLAGSHEILRFSSEGALLSKWGASGGADGQFGELWGLDTGPSGDVYVADTYGNRIQVFTADGAFVTKWGDYGSKPGQFIYPYGIAVGPSGEVYVAYTANARVQRFSADGALLGTWGGSGRGQGRFHTPTAIAADPAGYVYVADRAEPYPYEGRARVQKFTADGQFVTEWYDGPRSLSPGRPRISSTVGRRTTKRSATFSFRSRSKGVRYACRLSGERVSPKLDKWSSCTSPKRYARLRPGRKVFQVRAIRGIYPSHDASRSWLIVAGG
jgi:DNA-binding beta-propeller fold protein YncE